MVTNKSLTDVSQPAHTSGQSNVDILPQADGNCLAEQHLFLIEHSLLYYLLYSNFFVRLQVGCIAKDNSSKYWMWTMDIGPFKLMYKYRLHYIIILFYHLHWLPHLVCVTIRSYTVVWLFNENVTFSKQSHTKVNHRTPKQNAITLCNTE